MTKYRYPHLRLLLCVASVVMPAAPDTWADTTPSTATVTINVTLIDEPCIINDGQPIDVDFGDDLLTTQIDGHHYQKTVEYTLDCKSASSSALRMMISGIAASFDNAVLQASQPDLGISVLINERPQALNSWLKFDVNSKPVLQVVPVKAAGGTVNAGEFTATAALTVDYQ